jgi:hypothetical protein
MSNPTYPNGVTYVDGATYWSADGKNVMCNVTIQGYSGTHQHVAQDGDPDTQPLYDDLQSGKYGTIAPYVAVDPPPPIGDDALQAVSATGTETGKAEQGSKTVSATEVAGTVAEAAPAPAQDDGGGSKGASGEEKGA